MKYSRTQAVLTLVFLCLGCEAWAHTSEDALRRRLSDCKAALGEAVAASRVEFDKELDSKIARHKDGSEKLDFFAHVHLVEMRGKKNLRSRAVHGIPGPAYAEVFGRHKARLVTACKEAIDVYQKVIDEAKRDGLENLATNIDRELDRLRTVVIQEIMNDPDEVKKLLAGLERRTPDWLIVARKYRDRLYFPMRQLGAKEDASPTGLPPIGGQPIGGRQFVEQNPPEAEFLQFRKVDDRSAPGGVPPGMFPPGAGTPDADSEIPNDQRYAKLVERLPDLERFENITRNIILNGHQALTPDVQDFLKNQGKSVERSIIDINGAVVDLMEMPVFDEELGESRDPTAGEQVGRFLLGGALMRLHNSQADLLLKGEFQEVARDLRQVRFNVWRLIERDMRKRPLIENDLESQFVAKLITSPNEHLGRLTVTNQSDKHFSNVLILFENTLLSSRKGRLAGYVADDWNAGETIEFPDVYFGQDRMEGTNGQVYIKRKEKSPSKSDATCDPSAFRFLIADETGVLLESRLTQWPGDRVEINEAERLDEHSVITLDFWRPHAGAAGLVKQANAAIGSYNRDLDSNRDVLQSYLSQSKKNSKSLSENARRELADDQTRFKAGKLPITFHNGMSAAFFLSRASLLDELLAIQSHAKSNGAADVEAWISEIETQVKETPILAPIKAARKLEPKATEDLFAEASNNYGLFVGRYHDYLTTLENDIMSLSKGKKPRLDIEACWTAVKKLRSEGTYPEFIAENKKWNLANRYEKYNQLQAILVDRAGVEKNRLERYIEHRKKVIEREFGALVKGHTTVAE